MTLSWSPARLAGRLAPVYAGLRVWKLPATAQAGSPLGHSSVDEGMAGGSMATSTGLTGAGLAGSDGVRGVPFASSWRRAHLTVDQRVWQGGGQLAGRRPGRS